MTFFCTPDTTRYMLNNLRIAEWWHWILKVWRIPKWWHESLHTTVFLQHFDENLIILLKICLNYRIIIYNHPNLWFEFAEILWKFYFELWIKV